MKIHWEIEATNLLGAAILRESKKEAELALRNAGINFYIVLVRHMVDTRLLAADGHTRPKSYWICQSSQRERLSSMWLTNTNS